MDVLSVRQKHILISSYDGSVQVIDTRQKAIALLRYVNNLSSDQRTEDQEADVIRRAVMLAFVDIDSLEAYSLGAGDNAVIKSRVLYRDKIISNVIESMECTPQQNNPPGSRYYRIGQNDICLAASGEAWT